MRDREYETYIRKTKDELMHWEKPQEAEKPKQPTLERPRQTLPPPFQTKVLFVTAQKCPITTITNFNPCIFYACVLF